MRTYEELVKEAIQKAHEEAAAKAAAEAKAKEEEMKTFEVGKTYATNSICDHNCWFIYTVLKRTEKTVWIRDKFGNEKRCKIHSGGYYKNETIYPQGHYSMCPVLGAEDEVAA